MAIRPINKRNVSGRPLWECLCDCGNIKELAHERLTRGVTISCGCARGQGLGLLPEQRRADGRTATHIRRARRSTAGKFTEGEVRDLYDKQKGKCIYCRAKLGADFHRDHITPLAKGGANEIHNIQLLCPSCNLRKQATDPFVFANRLGQLL